MKKIVRTFLVPVVAIIIFLKVPKPWNAYCVMLAAIVAVYWEIQKKKGKNHQERERPYTVNLGPLFPRLLGASFGRIFLCIVIYSFVMTAFAALQHEPSRKLIKSIILQTNNTHEGNDDNAK